LGELFDTILTGPVINGLMMLSNIFGDSCGLAIIMVTLIVNIVILPLTIRQTRSMKAMQAIQPKLQEIQKKYAKDKQKLQQEMMKLYKEEGINPIGCAVPLLVQMPIIIGLYQGIMQALPTTPERLIGLSKHVYDFPLVQDAVPPDSHFLGLDLSQPNFIMVLVIMASMWLSQKMSTATKSTDPKQQQMQQMMQWMMPLFLGFIFLSLPSGLGLYIVVMSIFRMIVQYFIVGSMGGLEPLRQRVARVLASGRVLPGRSGNGDASDDAVWAPSEDLTSADNKPAPPQGGAVTEKGSGDGRTRGKRKNRRRGR